ncbi:DHA2 family efflux MFS transporter permease subunit [Hyphomonas atlantica]|jgi:EmrB/QacA subfamily drug resistance transporter|uniref:DHA2 family efflux MFS transporter permease subunit n=1 Tax=Hyphomonas atlantica TaxID=1280948 RepID=UPI0032B26E2B|nr:DHA2 family efflux MFS transporter permease subunit [Gammaproteobacteria bacterium]
MTSAPRPDSIEGLFARFGPSYRWLVTATVMMGTIATILTATIVNVALPDIMGAFGMGQDKAQLLSTGFLAAMTGTMLLNAWMVETLGQRATFMLALTVFIAASAMGGLAPAEGVLILARVLQGGAAGILQPLAMQTIFLVFPPEKRGSAMGIYGIGVVLAPALGPTLGGIMVDSFSWRYVFFMAVPFCLIGLFLATIFMPGRAASGPPRRFDWIGFGLMTVFLVTLLNGLSNGQRDGWFSDSILRDFAVALVSGIGFIVWELRTPAPMLNLKLFTNRVYAGASVVAFIFGAGIYGSTFLIPLFVQTIQGYTPTRSGLLLMPAGLILALVFPIAGRLTDKTPAYATIMFGLAVFALSSFLMTGVDTNTSFWLFAWWIMLGRIGLGFIMPSLNAGALKALPMTLLGQGSGAINFVRQLGGAFGVNLLSIALERRSQLYIDSFTAAQHAGNSATADMLREVTGLLAQAGVPEAIRQAGAMNYLGRVIYSQGNMLGYRDSFFIVGAIFLAALVPALQASEAMRHPPSSQNAIQQSR